MRHPANVRHYDERTFGERAADRLAAVVGSWPFILVQCVLIVCWMLLNGFILWHLLGTRPFDPYPWILLNLCLSLQAAFTGPVLQLSGNRQAEKDRERSEHDYSVNLSTVRALRKLAEHLECDVTAELSEIRHLLTAEETP